MNIFKIIILDSMCLLFPMIIYLLYLSTNKTLKNKEIYKSLSYISSFYLLYCFNINTLSTILVLHALIIISYIEDKYILANVFAMFIIILFKSELNYIWIFIPLYIVSLSLYQLNKRKIRNNTLFLEIFVLISSIVFSLIVDEFNISLILSYIFICNLTYCMNSIGKRILRTNMTYKELQKEKQIRLSLFKITHEIKNPIAVCKGYLDMLNVNDNNQVKKYIPIIKSEIERLLSILQDYLLINKANMDLDIMDINMLIEDTIEKMQPMFSERNVNIDVNLIEDEVFINGDYNRLSQVLINLFKNSVEAIECNNGEIQICSTIKNGNYYIEIEDNGCGMDKDVILRMKEPFYTTKLRGSGLGVSLIYEIVEAHGGKVKYASEYGKGTKVTLTFPLYNY